MEDMYSRKYGLCLALLLTQFTNPGDLMANPDRYSQYTQQLEIGTKVEPNFIRLEVLVDEIIKKKKPFLVDVRTKEEYNQAHIKGSVSIPLGEIHLRLAEIPKDRLVVLY